MASKRFLAPVIAGLAITGVIGVSASPALAANASPTAAAAAQNPTRATAAAPITQAIPGVGTFAGAFTPTGFTSSNGQLSVTGLVTGTLTSLTGVTTPVSQVVTAPVVSAAQPGSCNVLSLQLGPLHLDLLGLVVDLNQVNLDITAQQGPGNLLGNLLCTVANLLNGGNAGGGLANLLNQLLGL